MAREAAAIWGVYHQLELLFLATSLTAAPNFWTILLLAIEAIIQHEKKGFRLLEKVQILASFTSSSCFQLSSLLLVISWMELYNTQNNHKSKKNKIERKIGK